MKIAFIIAHKRNNVVVVFETLKVQSFIVTEVSDCGLLRAYSSDSVLFLSWVAECVADGVAMSSRRANSHSQYDIPHSHDDAARVSHTVAVNEGCFYYCW